MARLTGKNGSVYLAGSTTKLTDSFVWEYEEMQQVDACSIIGESFEVYAANVSTARVRIQSYVSGSTSPLSNVMDTSRVTNAGVGTIVSFMLEGLDGTSTVPGAAPYVSGTGFITRSQLRVARDGMIVDEMEIQVDGGATITVH